MDAMPGMGGEAVCELGVTSSWSIQLLGHPDVGQPWGLQMCHIHGQRWDSQGWCFTSLVFRHLPCS